MPPLTFSDKWRLRPVICRRRRTEEKRRLSASEVCGCCYVKQLCICGSSQRLPLPPAAASPLELPHRCGGVASEFQFAGYRPGKSKFSGCLHHYSWGKNLPRSEGGFPTRRKPGVILPHRQNPPKTLSVSSLAHSSSAYHLSRVSHGMENGEGFLESSSRYRSVQAATFFDASARGRERNCQEA